MVTVHRDENFGEVCCEVPSGKRRTRDAKPGNVLSAKYRPGHLRPMDKPDLRRALRSSRRIRKRLKGGGSKVRLFERSRGSPRRAIDNHNDCLATDGVRSSCSKKSLLPSRWRRSRNRDDCCDEVVEPSCGIEVGTARSCGKTRTFRPLDLLCKSSRRRHRERETKRRRLERLPSCLTQTPPRSPRTLSPCFCSPAHPHYQSTLKPPSAHRLHSRTQLTHTPCNLCSSSAHVPSACSLSAVSMSGVQISCRSCQTCPYPSRRAPRARSPFFDRPLSTSESSYATPSSYYLSACHPSSSAPSPARSKGSCSMPTYNSSSTRPPTCQLPSSCPSSTYQRDPRPDGRGCYTCGGCGGAACSDNSVVGRFNDDGCCGTESHAGQPCKCKCQTCKGFHPVGGCGGQSCGRIYSCAGSGGGTCCFPRNTKRRSGPQCCGGGNPGCGGCC